MFLSHLPPAALILAAGPATAPVDLSRIARTLDHEPKYSTRAPRYCLVVFGIDARTLVWLVQDGDVLHVLASPDGKAAPKWRTAARSYTTYTIGDVRGQGGAVHYKNLRYLAYPRNPKLLVHVDGRQQRAGRDVRGKLEFGPSAKDAPVIHFNGPRTLDLFFDQQPFRPGSSEDLSVVVGTHGIGPGTFTHVNTDAYPKGAWPWATIEYPAKPGGKPILARARLKEE